MRPEIDRQIKHTIPDSWSPGLRPKISKQKEHTSPISWNPGIPGIQLPGNPCGPRLTNKKNTQYPTAEDQEFLGVPGNPRGPKLTDQKKLYVGNLERPGRSFRGVKEGLEGSLVEHWGDFWAKFRESLRRSFGG